MPIQTEWLSPKWPAPPRVRAVSTLRLGGVSAPPYATFNLGDHVGDLPSAVAENRRRLTEQLSLPSAPRWLSQVHGFSARNAEGINGGEEGDASFTSERGVVCVVMTADCLPVLFCDRAGTRVAAAHAGWRGLQGGVLEQTVAALGGAPGELLAWLGPAIGPDAFEVGAEVREAFLDDDPLAAASFRPSSNGRWFTDIYALARRRLGAVGVTAVGGGDRCTYSEPEQFFSYRRDGVTGRQASLIWLANE